MVSPRRPRSPRGRTREVARRLAETYPEALCELDFRTPFQLLVATILSAQTTDALVNTVTPRLYAEYPTADDLAAADPREVEEIIRPTGFYMNKTKSLLGMANGLVERFGGEVPTALEDLVTLPGVGRKTANVVRSVAFRLPGLPVDTHVRRVARRLALTAHDDPVKIELELNSYLPPDERGDFSLRMILHGRRVCLARTPRCAECSLEDICPSSTVPRAAARSLATDGPGGMMTPQPGSRHLVCSDSRDPPPGVARATAPPTRGRRRFSVPVVRRGQRSAARQGAQQRSLGHFERPFGLVDGCHEIVTILTKMTARQVADPAVVVADRLRRRRQLGGRRARALAPHAPTIAAHG